MYWLDAKTWAEGFALSLAIAIGLVAAMPATGPAGPAADPPDEEPCPALSAVEIQLDGLEGLAPAAQAERMRAVAAVLEAHLPPEHAPALAELGELAREVPPPARVFLRRAERLLGRALAHEDRPLSAWAGSRSPR